MLHSAALAEIVPVILAGGEGRRLWPLSTPARPKPFLKTGRGRSLLQRTAARTVAMQPSFVVCNERHRALVLEQVSAGQIILEPVGRGTAPAVAAVAHFLARKGDPLLLVLPSDHAIRDPAILLEAVGRGVGAARDGALVMFGVPPRHPSPHYGYMRAGDALGDGVYKALSFVEKPDRKTAQLYIQGGNCYWNSGIFLFSARRWLAALKEHQPDIHDAAYGALSAASRLRNAIILNRDIFSACPALSVDYAVMEKAENCAVVPVAMEWSDLGTWPSLLADSVKIRIGKA